MADTWRQERDRYSDRDLDGLSDERFSKKSVKGGEARRRYEILQEERQLKKMLDDDPFNNWA